VAEVVETHYLCDVCGDPAERGPYPKFMAADPNYRDSHVRAFRVEAEPTPWYVTLTRPFRAHRVGSIRQTEIHLCRRHKDAIEEALKP
jgi:hypothetical protein